MFSKHVWYNRRHQAEVFITDEGVVSGTIVAYEGTVFLVNPRPDILLALYQEAKLKRILSLKGVVLTNATVELTRGLCALLNYSRGLRRRAPLNVITRTGTDLSHEVLTKCCTPLRGAATYDVRLTTLCEGERYPMGKGVVHFEGATQGVAGEHPYLIVSTERDCTLHYFDESHSGIMSLPQEVEGLKKPDLIIRAAELPGRVQRKHQGVILSQ
jgi:hypothetical protein